MSVPIHLKRSLYSSEAYRALSKVVELEDKIAAARKQKTGAWWLKRKPASCMFSKLEAQADGEIVVKIDQDFLGGRSTVDAKTRLACTKFYVDGMKRLLGEAEAEAELTKAEVESCVSAVMKSARQEEVEMTLKLLTSRGSLDSFVKKLPEDQAELARKLIGKPNDPITASRNSVLESAVELKKQEMQAAERDLQDWYDGEVKKLADELAKRLNMARAPFQAEISKLREMMTLPSK